MMLPTGSGIGDLSLQASPSKARAEALEAHSWTMVLTWLSAAYHPSPVPSFERNGTTLKALQSLMTEGVAADKLRDLLFQAQLEEVKIVRDRLAVRTENRPDSLLDTLDSSLSESAKSALDSLASSVVLLGCPRSTTSKSVLDNLQSRILNIPRETFALETQLSNINRLVADLQAETAKLQTPAVKPPEYESPEHHESVSHLEVQPSTPLSSMSSSAVDYSYLHAQTLQHQRETKQLMLKCAEYQDRVATLERQAASQTTAVPRVADLAAKQQAVDQKKTRVQTLEKSIGDFNGLPPDVDASRAEVQRAQTELDTLKRNRDKLFQSLGG